MRTFKIGDVEHTVDCNAFTPFVYAEEFMVERNGKKVHEDINAAVDEVMAFMQEHGLPPMLKMLQLFWAFEKTANPKVPSFRAWLKSMPREALSLTESDGWAKAVMEEINDAFFPTVAQPDVAGETA